MDNELKTWLKNIEQAIEEINSLIMSAFLGG